MVTTHAARTGHSPIYLATAEAHDVEMAKRIHRHRERRGKAWRTIEASYLVSFSGLPEGAPVLFECLTLWLSNLLAKADVEAGVVELLKGLATAPGPVVVVGNEVGLGIVPDNYRTNTCKRQSINLA